MTFAGVTELLLYADTVSSPEMRHEVPVVLLDRFLYVERDARRVAIVHAFEHERLAALDEIEVVSPEHFGLDDLIRQRLPAHEAMGAIAERACRELGLERPAVPPTFPLEMADRLRAAGIEVRVDRDLFAMRRRTKSDVEVAGIRKAQHACEAALDAAREILRRAVETAGVLEVDGVPLTCELLRERIDAVFRDHGVLAREYTVSHGAQTAVMHEFGHGEILPGEPIVIDLWPQDPETTCYSDMTRTYVVGSVSPKLRASHLAVRDALERVISVVRPGVNGRELMALACDLLHERGYPTLLHKEPNAVLEDGFIHGLGHGVGLEMHEPPAVGRIGDDLVEGDVFTVEPGLYRPGVGGVRLEDIVLVTPQGCENLTNYAYDLEP